MSKAVNASIRSSRYSEPWWSVTPAIYTWTLITVAAPPLPPVDITMGGEFMVLTGGSQVLGAYFQTTKAGAHTIRIRLWRAGVSVAMADIACPGAGWYQGLFATPYVVAAADAPAQMFIISMYAGTQYCYWNQGGAASTVYGFMNQYGWEYPRLYSAGDSAPGTWEITGATWPIDPIVYL